MVAVNNGTPSSGSKYFQSSHPIPYTLAGTVKAAMYNADTLANLEKFPFLLRIEPPSLTTARNH